jgi:hypothetical protein
MYCLQKNVFQIIWYNELILKRSIHWNTAQNHYLVDRHKVSWIFFFWLLGRELSNSCIVIFVAYLWYTEYSPSKTVYFSRKWGISYFIHIKIYCQKGVYTKYQKGNANVYIHYYQSLCRRISNCFVFMLFYILIIYR